jgi:hypothetical protein
MGDSGKDVPMQRGTDRAAVAALQRALREELGLSIPFTSEEYRAALGRVRAQRGRTPSQQALPCTQVQADGTFVLPVPEDLSPIEQEHRKFHQLAHVVLKHVRPGKTTYTAEEERYAEAFADAMMAQGLGSVAVE